MNICTHSLGTVSIPPGGENVFGDDVIMGEAYDADTSCSICRMPFDSSVNAPVAAMGTITLAPCGHRFHRRCFQMSQLMNKKHTSYSNNAQRKAHCPLCRTPTTTRVPARNNSKARNGLHRKALGPPTADIALHLPAQAEPQGLLWKTLSTGALPVKAEELVPLTTDDARWSQMVTKCTPLYMPSHGLHGTFVSTTPTFVRVRVYPEDTERRFGKHKVAGFAASWTGLTVSASESSDGQVTV